MIMATDRILEDICADDCKSHYCLLKEFIKHGNFSDRQLEQLKCVELYKFNQGKQLGMDIGWQKAWLDWVDNGYAAKFAEVYNPELMFKDLYRKVVGD
jgi:hypothetical protein